MEEIFFIGDELSAIAYAIAGVSVRIVDTGGTGEALDALAEREDLRLVLIAAPHADALGLEELSRRMRLGRPPLMVVGDAAGRGTMPDFSTLLKRRLGVAT